MKLEQEKIKAKADAEKDVSKDVLEERELAEED